MREFGKYTTIVILGFTGFILCQTYGIVQVVYIIYIRLNHNGRVCSGDFVSNNSYIGFDQAN